MIQQMQTSISTMEAIPWNQPLMHEPFGLLKIRINFGNDGPIIKK
jgi:hypothetical protein